MCNVRLIFAVFLPNLADSSFEQSIKSSQFIFWDDDLEIRAIVGDNGVLLDGAIPRIRHGEFIDDANSSAVDRAKKKRDANLVRTICTHFAAFGLAKRAFNFPVSPPSASFQDWHSSVRPQL